MQCPAHLLIEDETGKKVGYLSDGTFIFEIENASRVYGLGENWMLPLNHEYKVSIFGEGLGKYNITIISPVENGVKIFGVTNVKIFKNMVDVIETDLNQDISIGSTGNKNYSLNISYLVNETIEFLYCFNLSCGPNETNYIWLSSETFGNITFGIDENGDGKIDKQEYSPFASISFPKSWSILKGKVKISGKIVNFAGKDIQISIRIDNGSWISLNGLEWNYLWDTTNVDNGMHTIYVKVWENKRYSNIQSIRVIVNNKKGGIPGFEAIAFLAAVLAVAWARKRKK